MRVTGWLRRNPIEVLWGLFAICNWFAMIAWPAWETIPFHFVWISLTIVYGFRVWSPGVTGAILGTVILATGASIMSDAFAGLQLWGELFEVPLMSAMFLAMVWHARRRVEAMRVAEDVSEQRARLLDKQESFLHDVSHELRTPVTIARGHLELMTWDHPGSPELRVALDELGRIERIIDRLLLLAKSAQPDFVHPVDVERESFLSDVFLRWSGIAERAWKLEVEPEAATVHADPDALLEALDALLENAVKYSEPQAPIELRASVEGADTVLEVHDGGTGIEPEALDRIFQRFGRADAARTRSPGGAGLGLAIVAEIARAHGGSCTVTSSASGSTFALRLPSRRTAPVTPLLGEPVPA